MESKAQGAIEYLLIIGAAVIIAVIVIALMMSLSGEGTGAVEESGIDSAYSGLMGIKDKYQGVMTVTFKFIGGQITDIIVPAMVEGTTLNDLFPNAPIGTKALDELDVDISEVKTVVGNWDPNSEVDEGERVKITPASDFEQPIAIEQSDVIMIYDCAGLQAINNNLSGSYALGMNIDCGLDNFEPIAFDSKSPFTGTLEGNGMGIKFSSSYDFGDYNVGLFGNVVGATIKDVEILAGSFVYGFIAGGIVGVASMDSEIIGELSTNNVTSTSGILPPVNDLGLVGKRI